MDPRLARRRNLGLLVMGCCLVLAAWIVFLVLNLPKHYTASMRSPPRSRRTPT
jgi:hypothetical protein